jgi:hypothetical protein
MQQALVVGISTFDTADAYAATTADSVKGKALWGRAVPRPGDLHEERQDAEVKLDAGLLTVMDDVLQSVIQRDPAMTTSLRSSTVN